MDRMCRLCLEDGPDLSPIQECEQDNNVNTEDPIGQNLVQLIRKYLSIQIIKTECTESQFICTVCQTLIEEWHRFHSACRKNDETYQRRQFELLQRAEQREENLPPLSTDFKQEVETIAEDLVEAYLDPEFEEIVLEEQRHRSAVPDEDGDDAGSECTTSEYEVIVKVEPPKWKEKSTPLSVVPKKRGRPKKIAEEGVNGKPQYKKRERAEVCTICGKFNTHLKEHMRMHNNERRYQCSYCSKTFVTSSNYWSHINIHTRARMYKCDLCDKQFTSSNILKRHRLTHTKERIYLCPVCGKAFYNPTILTGHQRAHFEEPKIKCSECDKLFLTNSDLRKHFSKHLLVKPFSCEICSRAFGRKDNLKTHMKVHRGSKVAKSDSVEAPSDG